MLVSLTIHEAAHAWTADKLGDSTARKRGRVSLNPVVHIDPIGTILLPLIAAFSRFPIIGWAKPVPVDIRQLRRGRQDYVLVVAAGPGSNFLQALVGAVVFHLTPDLSVLGAIAHDYVQVNLLLALFNLIPIPPLDGGNMLAALLPRGADAAVNFLGQFGFLLLYGLLYFGVVDALILPPTLFFERILLQ